MRNTIAKKIRKGAAQKGLSRADYQAQKETYKKLNRPFKKFIAQKTKEAGAENV